MADVLIDSAQVIGEWDPVGRSWAARDWTPGPAGTAGLDLPGGVELDIDVAAPGTFVGLRVDWAGADETRRAGRRALRRLLGDDRAAELLALDAGPGLPVRLGQSGPYTARTTRTSWSRRRHERGVAPGLARVALAGAAAVGPGATAAVQALSWLDSAIAAASVGPGVGFGARARRDAALAAALLLDVARRGELDNQPVDPVDLGTALQDLLPVLVDELTAPVRALRADIATGRIRLRPTPPAAAAAADASAAFDRRRFAAGAAAAPAAMPAMRSMASEAAPRRAVARLLTVDRRSLPDAFAGAAVAARATTPSEAELRIAGQAMAATGWWARAFGDGDDDVVLAAAPLLPAGRDAVARLLVPPAQLAGIEIDVTDSPGEPREPRRARRIVDAVTTGQAAARAERLGLSASARQRWGAAAASWKAAGAGEKAGLASELAQGRSAPDRIPPPLLADALIEEAEG